MEKITRAYREWLIQLKKQIRSSQVKASLQVNVELLNLYWHLGKEILDKEKNKGWGNKLIAQLSIDLLKEFPGMKGFSRTNLYYIRQWVLFYRDSLIVQQVAGQLPQTFSVQKQPGG